MIEGAGLTFYCIAKKSKKTDCFSLPGCGKITHRVRPVYNERMGTYVARQTVDELITAYEQELIKMGYSDITLKYYRRCWKNLRAHFAKCGQILYSHKIAMDYVKSVCGRDITDPILQITSREAYLYRIVCSLTDFQECGVIRRMYIRRMPYKGSQASKAILDEFSACLDRDGLSDSTMKTVRRTSERFMSFMDAHNMSLRDLNVSFLRKYFTTLSGYSKKTLEVTTYSFRRYLLFLYKRNYIDRDLTSCVPKVKAVSQTNIPSVWNTEDYVKVLEFVNRNTSIGKRDYAVLLLAGKLGMRSIDIKQLTFSDINWDRKEVAFVQSKTGMPTVLPLLPEIGWALIDYIRNGRPAAESEYIFLRHAAPFSPLTKDNHLYHTLKKYTMKADIKREGKRSGLHSLRHTLATELMEHHTPLKEISEVLGHTNSDTTGIYLKTSVDLLRECAQEIDHGI